MFSGEGEERKTEPEIPPVQRIETVIPFSAIVRGAIQVDGDIRVDGFYEGPIETSGNLAIDEHARVLSNIVAHRASIAGAVKGDVSAHHVEVLGTGHIWGNITGDSVSLAPGSVVNGQVTMHTDVTVEELFGELELIELPDLTPTPSPDVSPEPGLSLPEPTAYPGSTLSLEPTTLEEPVSSVVPATRPAPVLRLLRWLWTYGLTIPLIILVVGGAFLVYISRPDQSHPSQVRSVTATIPPPTQAQIISNNSRPLATASLTPTAILTLSPTATSVPAPAPTPATVPTAVLDGGRVIEVGLSHVSTLNPLLAAPDDDLSRAIGSLLFDSLLRVNPQSGALTSGLARDWEISDDGRVLTFRLRSDVTFHDGRSLSAADVYSTLVLAGDPAGPSSYPFDLAHVSQVSAPDSTTVVITLDEPACDALFTVGRVPILPGHLLEGQGSVSAVFNQRPVGTGPFVFASREADGSIVLNANEVYWAGRPRLDSWTYRVASDVESLQEALRLGQAHLARLPDDMKATLLPEGYRVLSYPAHRWHALALNNKHSLMGDVTVRRALGLALDREELLVAILDGQGTLIDAPWLPTHWALEGVSLTPLPYAPDQARQLLAASGWSDTDGDGLLDKNGQQLHLNISTHPRDPIRERIAMLTQQYWRAMGISAHVNILPWGIFLDDLFRHTFDVAVLDWPLEAAPDQTWLWASNENDRGAGFNLVSYASSQADALLRQARAAPGCDPAYRNNAYRGLAQQLAADQPYVFLFAAHRRLAVVEALAGPQPGPYNGLYWNVVQWSINQ